MPPQNQGGDQPGAPTDAPVTDPNAGQGGGAWTPPAGGDVPTDAPEPMTPPAPEQAPPAPAGPAEAPGTDTGTPGQ